MRTLLIAVVAGGFLTPCVAQEPGDAPPAAELRQWTDTTGKFQIDAKFIAFADNQVTLEREDGSTLMVPISRLSADDRAFVRAELRRRREAARPKDDRPARDELPKLNDRGLGILPLKEPRVFVHIEGMPAPKPQDCVRARWTDPDKDPQLLIDAQAERLKTAGVRHQEIEKKLFYGLTRVETHQLVLHTQLPLAEARKTALALEAMKTHLQQATGTMMLSPLRVEEDEMILVVGRANYMRLLKMVEVENEGNLGESWHLLPEVSGGTVGRTSVFYVQEPFLYMASHQAVSKAAGLSIQKASGERCPQWMVAGFASYCENVVLKKNLVRKVNYQINETPIGPNWALEVKRLAAARALKPWDQVMKLELRDFEAIDYIQSYAMTAYLFQRDPQKFLDLLELFADGGEVTPSIEKAYGQSTAELQTDWVRWLLRA